jgi:hypothetical protein
MYPRSTHSVNAEEGLSEPHLFNVAPRRMGCSLLVGDSRHVRLAALQLQPSNAMPALLTLDEMTPWTDKKPVRFSPEEANMDSFLKDNL